MAVRYYKSELTVSVESSSRSRNLLGVLISGLVLLVLSTVIVTAIVLINPDVISGHEQAAGRRPISLEEAFLHELSPDSYSFSWSTGPNKSDELLFECHKNLVSLLLTEGASSQPFQDPCYPPPPPSSSSPNSTANTSQQAPTVLVSNDTLAGVNYQGFKFSPSKRYLLIYTARKRIFRHSFTATYYIIDTRTNQILHLDTQQQQLQPLSTGSGARQFQQLDSTTNPLNQAPDSGEAPSARFQLVDWFSAPSSYSSAPASSQQKESQPQLDEGLVLIQDNDIYVIPSLQQSDDNDRAINVRRLTYTGKPGELFNGHPDWLYEEEILAGADSAYQVSPEASTLAYLSFNDSLVELMPYSIYGGFDRIIPHTEQIRYPKAGRINPSVAVYVVERFASSSSAKSFRVTLPSQLQREQHYINRIKWLTEDHLSLIWLNRNQNRSSLLVCSRHSGWTCRINYQLSSPGGWLDMTDDLFPLDNTSYLAIVPKFEGAQVGSFKHIVRLYMDKSAPAQFLTGGRREVTSIDGVSIARGLVYYTATPENEPGQRQTYAAPLLTAPPLDASKQQQQHECITCNLFPAQECLYNSVRMSPSGDLFVVYCEGPDVPRIQLRSTPGAHTNHSSRLLWTMVDNGELRRKFAESLWKPDTMRLRVPIAGTNYSASVILLLPPHLPARSTAALMRFRAGGSSPGAASSFLANAFPVGSAATTTLSSQRQRRAPQDTPITSSSSSSSSTATNSNNNNNQQRPFHHFYTLDTLDQYVAQSGGLQYPMVVSVYGGPGSQKVDYRFDINLGHYLATSRNTIYAMIDGRGSANEGTNRLYELYQRFGTVEIQDQIDIATYLAHNLTFVDPNRVAIWGWSYGGYAAAMALAKSNERYLKASSTHPLPTQNSIPSKGIFECAASVAPVTDWIYYDTAYTERYMSSPYSNEQYDFQSVGDHNLSSISGGAKTPPQPLPRSILMPSSGEFKESSSNGTTNKGSTVDSLSSGQVNSSSSSQPIFKQIMQQHRKKALAKSTGELTDTNERYRKASLTGVSNNIDKKRYLLIHGTADDNVHFQQSIMLMKKLISQNIMFETRIYPDQNHGISNRPDRIHLGTTLATFFAECFDMV